MSPKKTPKDADTSAAAEPTPPPAAEVTVETVETVETPAAPRPQRSAGRTRGMIAAGAAGLLLVGGAAGFGIGRATGDDEGPRFDRTDQFLPGHPGPGSRHPGDSRDQRNRPPMPDRDGGPGGRINGDDFPPAPGSGGSEEGSSGT